MTGSFEGTLQGDANTFIASSAGPVSFGGTPGPALAFLYSFSDFALGGGAPPTLTVNGAFLDIAACTTVDCLEDGFYFSVGTSADSFFGGPFYGGGPSFGGTPPDQFILEAYIPTNWSASVQNSMIPEPAAGGLMLVSLSGLALLRRRSIASAIMQKATRRTGFAIAATLVISMVASAQDKPQDKPMVISGAASGAPVAAQEFNGDVRDLPTVTPSKNFIREANRVRKSGVGSKGYPSTPKMDPLLKAPDAGKSPGRQASSSNAAFGATALNFEGIAFSGSSNPDTVGDVGTNHYIHMANGANGALVKIFDKSGATLAATFDLHSLAAPASRCAVGSGDPIVLYDEAANRWLLSEIATAMDGQPNFLCVYISKTGDPVTGGWWTYQFQTVGFPDYPKYAVWPTAYLVSANEVGGPGGDVSSAYALDRAQMLNGGAASFNRFSAPQLPQSAGFNSFIPADVDGSTAPPAGAPGYFARHVDDEYHFNASTSFDYLEMWALRPNFTTPANATFTRLPNVRLADFDSKICDAGAANCVSQPGKPFSLDSLPEMTLWRLQYRRFNNLETIVGNFTVDATGQDRAGVRWFALNKAGFLNWSLGQQGTHSPDATHRWMGSIAMDACGNMALGYSASSGTVFPSIRYTGRLKNDAPGTMAQGEFQIIGGAASITGNRWGDYTSMNVDPSDGRTFWYTNQYVDAGGLWQTRIATFKFDTCAP